MKKILLLALIISVSSPLFAQTKRIAHRSHSGKNSTLVMTTGDNFGLPEHKKKDSTQKPAPVIKKKPLGRKPTKRKTSISK
jgi:hypothetical protein